MATDEFGGVAVSESAKDEFGGVRVAPQPKGVEVSEQIPHAMEARLEAGSEARKREGGLLQTIPQGLEFISTPEGRTKLWEAVKKYPSKFLDDTINMGKLPGDVASGHVDLSTEEGMDQAIGLGMLVAGSRLNKLSATGKTSGLAVTMGESVSRISKGPMGEIYDLPIGTAARSEDFVTAAQIVAGEKAPMAVQEKMLAAYETAGIHPSEIAHDAQTNPILAQHLLSSEEFTLADLGETSWYKFNERDIELPKKLEGFRQDMSELGFESNVSDHFYRDITGKKRDIGEPSGIGKNDPKAVEVPTLADDLHEIVKDFKVEPTSLEPKEQLPPREESLQSGKDALLEKVSVGESAPKEKLSWDKFYRKAVDDLHPLKAVDEGAYELARLTRGQFGKAEHFIEHGTFDFNTYKTNGKGLTEILKPMKDDLSGLRSFMVAKRSMEIQDTGRISGIDYRVARQVAAAGEGKYAKIAEEVVDYQNRLLQYMKDSGVLSPAAYDSMVEAGKNYIPFYRVIGEATGGGEAGKSFGPGTPLKRLKGSERDVIDPLESIIKNTYAYVSIAERNAVGIKLIDALKKEGAEVQVSKGTGKDPALVEYLKENGVTDPEKLVDFIKSAIPEDGDTLGAFRNGVKETVKVNDPELVTAFRGLDQTSADMLTRVLAQPAKWLRTGATLSPDFIVRNIVRDFMTAFVNSGSALFSPIDTAKGLVGVIRKDADFQNWMKGGGANATMVALDRRYMQESLRQLNHETGLMERGWNVVASPYRGLRMLSELAENATRLGEFKKLVGEGGKENIQSAAFGSREVTLDFARIGASMRAYNMITAFGNAQIQGLDRIGRAFVDRPVNTTLKIAGGITMPSVLLWFANRDDPRYQELPHWQKDMFWIVMTKDHIYRIPKPFELGVVFGSGVERILDATIGKNDEAFDKFAKSVMGVMTPNYTPTFAQPVVEQFANRSTFSDRTLIPKGMEDKLPEYQYTPYTTEVTKKLGQVISAFPGVRGQATGPGAPFGPIARTMTSPILLENYIRSWSGGLGVYAMQAADAALRKAGVLPDPVTPTPTLADIPVVKAFVVRYPSATTQSIQDFYDKHEETKKYYDTWLAKAKEGDTDAMQRIQSAGGPIMFVRLDAIKETLSEHSKLVRDIYKNPTIKAPEKRQLIDSLYNNMIEIGKAGNGMLKASEKALKTATEAAP